MNFMFLMMALSLLTWAGTVSAADDCYSLDADDNTWVEVLVQKDWANELLEYLEENYGSLENLKFGTLLNNLKHIMKQKKR